MELREIARLLMRRYKTILATVIVCLLPALAVISFQSPEYRATTRIYVDVITPTDATSYGLSLANGVAQSRTITFKELVSTPLILDGVLNNLQLDITVDELASHVTAQSALDTAIVDIFVDWSEPEMATLIANEIGTEVITVLGGDENAASPLRLVQAQPARLPTAPSTPNPTLMLGFAAFGGLLLGAAFALLSQGFQRRIYSVEQLAAFPVPVLGMVAPDQHTALRSLAGTLMSADRLKHARTVAVVSAEARPEKAEIAHNLAVSLADMAEDFTIIDSPARLAQREPIENPDRIDIALVMVTLGQDSTPGITTTLDHLELLGVSVGGFVLVKPPRVKFLHRANPGTRNAS